MTMSLDPLLGVIGRLQQPVDSRDDVRKRRSPAQSPDDRTDLQERPATVEMAVKVVDLLELIEIDEQPRQRLVRAHGPFGFLPEYLGQTPRVLELGQIVGDRQRLNALLPLYVVEPDSGRLEQHLERRTDARQDRRHLRSHRGDSHDRQLPCPADQPIAAETTVQRHVRLNIGTRVVRGGAC